MHLSDLKNFQKKWEDLVRQVQVNYKSLNPQERIFYNICWLQTQVDNGGIISFYYNSGADHVLETIDDLVSLNENEVAEILKTVNNLFPEESLSVMERRNKVIDSWPDGKYDELFNESDEKFYLLEQSLEEKLIRFIVDNKLIS